MGKVLTGCGVLGGLAVVAVVLLLGALMPEVGEARERMQAAAARLAALDAEHPFDPAGPVDPRRFAATLAARAELLPLAEAWVASLQPGGEDDPVSLTRIEAAVVAAPRLYEHVADVCQAHGLGARELGASGRRLWSALAGVASGAGGEALRELRDLQPELRERLADLRQRDPAVPAFDELVRDPRRGDDDERTSEQREPDPARVAEALLLIEADPAAVRAAVLPPEIEVALLRLDALVQETAS